jgi:hypothetical protein
MNMDLYNYYKFLLKRKPENVVGDFYTFRNTLNEKYIKKNKKYNSRNNNINEALTDDDIITGLPVNSRVKFNLPLMIKAIQYGMVILINYKGDKDNWRGGRERVIYPMVIGINRNTGNMLLRGWHLTGWSVSKRRNVSKEWRLFKTSNIKSMMFTGDFYRLLPKGYKMNDRVMTEKIIKAADFNEIRRNQDNLIKAGKLELVGDVTLGDEKSSTVIKVDARTTDTKLDLNNIFENDYMKPYKKDIETLKVTFLRNISKKDIIAIVGTYGVVNKTVKLYDGKDFIGNYKVRRSTKGKEILKVKNVDGQRFVDLYLFNKIIK